MKMTEFERLLYEHAARVETHMVSPLNKKTEVLTLTRNKKSSAKMRICLIAVAAAFLLGTTAFAISDGGWFSFREKEYSTLPTEQQFAEDVGYEPVLIECFENGYSYSSGSVMDNREIEGEELSEEGFKSAAFVYEKDGDLLFFNQEKSNSPVNNFGSLYKSVEGIELWYYSYTNKLVPEDYEPTEADKAAEESGELIISYGPEEISVIEVCSLSWVDDGINYSLMQMDGKLSPQELCRMAEEIITR